jgi:cytochrome c peroxidase
VLLPNASLPDDFAVQADGARLAGIAAANELAPGGMSDEGLARVIDFLHALTDPASLDLRSTVPPEVPSGLPVFD